MWILFLGKSKGSAFVHYCEVHCLVLTNMFICLLVFLIISSLLCMQLWKIYVTSKFKIVPQIF